MHQKDFINILSKGNPEAFRALFDEYFGPLCIFAMRFTRNKSSAEEVVHETFVKLWEQRNYISINESLSGYLYKSVQNNALNFLKKERIKNKHNELYAEKLKQAEEYFTVTQEHGLSIVLAKELESKILEAIDALPDQCKEIFKLSRFAGLKNQQIAEKKQITLNTVQKQISIALEKLRKNLDFYLPKAIQGLIFFQIFH